MGAQSGSRGGGGAAGVGRAAHGTHSAKTMPMGHVAKGRQLQHVREPREQWHGKDGLLGRPAGRSCDSTLSDETAVGGGLGSGALRTGPSSGPKSTPFHHHPPGQPWRPPPTPGGHHHCSTAVAATLQVHPLTATATATATERPLSHRRRVASATSSTTHALETLWERGPRQNHALILPPPRARQSLFPRKRRAKRR